jgi:hypothetical protein
VQELLIAAAQREVFGSEGLERTLCASQVLLELLNVHIGALQLLEEDLLLLRRVRQQVCLRLSLDKQRHEIVGDGPQRDFNLLHLRQHVGGALADGGKGLAAQGGSARMRMSTVRKSVSGSARPYM